MYHGTPAERAELRRTVIALPQKAPKSAKATASDLGQKISPSKAPKTSPVSESHTNAGTDRGRKRRRIHRKLEEEDEDILHGESEHDEAGLDDLDSGSEVNPPEEDSAALFPVVITTYEMIIKDRVHLSAYDFSYIGSPISRHSESCLMW